MLLSTARYRQYLTHLGDPGNHHRLWLWHWHASYGPRHNHSFPLPALPTITNITPTTTTITTSGRLYLSLATWNFPPSSSQIIPPHNQSSITTTILFIFHPSSSPPTLFFIHFLFSSSSSLFSTVSPCSVLQKRPWTRSSHSFRELRDIHTSLPSSILLSATLFDPSFLKPLSSIFYAS